MPKKILLADDSITIQKVVELTFSDGDYEVIATNNGAKAIQRLSEVRPDIILSDIIMPEKNGYEVCEYVKSHPEFRNVPVILLTGTFEPFDPDRAEKAGCDAVVTKPFESQSLIHKVEELIAQSASRAQEAPAFSSAPEADEYATAGPMPAVSPFAEDEDVHRAPTYEMPATFDAPSAPPQTPWGGAGAGTNAEASPFDNTAPSPAHAAAASENFSSPFDEPPAFHDHEPGVFDEGSAARPSDEMPLSAPAAWDEESPSSFDAGAAEEAPLSPSGTSTPEPLWGASLSTSAEDPGATKMIPKLTLDDFNAMQNTAAPSAPSPFEEEPPASGGETKMIPKLSFDDMQRMREEESRATAPAESPFEREEEPATTASSATPFESEEPALQSEGLGETKMIPKLSFDDIQRMRAEQEQSAAPDEDRGAEVIPFESAGPREVPAPRREEEEPIFRTSESPFEQEFEMPEDVESLPLREVESAPEEGTMFEEPAATESDALWSPAGAARPADEEPAFAESAEVEEAPAAAPEPVSDIPTPSAPLWSVTEPESITPEPPVFAPAETAVPLPPPSAAASAPQAPAASLDASAINDEVIERIARRVVEMLSDSVVRNIAWEVIPDMAEMVVKERIRQLENEA